MKRRGENRDAGTCWVSRTCLNTDMQRTNDNDDDNNKIISIRTGFRYCYWNIIVKLSFFLPPCTLLAVKLVWYFDPHWQQDVWWRISALKLSRRRSLPFSKRLDLFIQLGEDLVEKQNRVLIGSATTNQGDYLFCGARWPLVRPQ